MNTVVSLILGIVPSVVSAILVYILQHVIKENRRMKAEREAEREKRNRALEEGLTCLLRKALMDDYTKYTELGYITSKALEGGLLMYSSYKALGGNGMIDHMKDEIQELPIRD